MKYKVIKDIPTGWEVPAKVGDILTVGRWDDELTLMKEGKAVCDEDSFYANEHCKPIEEN